MQSRHSVIAAPHTSVWEAVAHWRELAIAALARMYLPERGMFAFRLRPGADGSTVLEGESLRYTAIALLGLAGEPEAAAAQALHGKSLQEACGALLERALLDDDVGAAALALWAARRLRHPQAGAMLERLQSLAPADGDYATVGVAWALSALAIRSESATDRALADRLAERLLASFRPGTGLFPHRPVGAKVAWLRGHVCCFADLVYPVQALSHYFTLTGRDQAATAAGACGAQMCRLQGPAGQWWWHYDVRSGEVIEHYPVYAIHQDAMGPMALLALEDACGVDHRDTIARSIAWLIHAPEIDGSLVDESAGVIWRKVARHEPKKLVRGIHAATSRLHPRLRMPWVDLPFPPGRVDYEARPYHMGWLLHAFSRERACQ